MSLPKYIDAGTEEETPRNGVLSLQKEWHSLLIGAYGGFLLLLRNELPFPALVTRYH